MGKIRVTLNSGLEFSFDRDTLNSIAIPLQNNELVIDKNGVAKWVKRS